MPYRFADDRRAYERKRETGKRRRKAQSKRRRTLPPRFIGVDGEGLSVPDGTHQPYVLFAANTGEYIEDYEAGLSTRACFDFLLKLQRSDRNARLIVFGGGYDMTQMLRDLPKDDAQRLAETGQVLWQFALNGWYFIRFFPGKLMTITRIVQHPTEHKIARARTTLYDVFGYFQTSFVKTLNDWGIGSESVRARIADMKDKRHDFASGDRPQIRDYCLEECTLLVDLMDAVGEAIHDAAMPMPKQWHGAGAVADALLSDRYMRDALEGSELPEEIERAYYGGRIETTRVGIVRAPLYEYDINSAYPHALSQLPPLEGTWTPESTYSPLIEHAVWFCRWDVRASHSGGRDHPVGRYLTPFPVRRKGRIWWPTTGAGWYLAPEVRAAVEVFGDAVQVDRGLVLSLAEPDARPWAWIHELYVERLRLKTLDALNGTNRNKPLKLGLNAMYGKTAQSGRWSLEQGDEDAEIRRGRWSNFYAAGWQTARTRARLLQAAAQSPESVVSLATDSVSATERLQLDLGGELGQWDETVYEQDCIVVHPGFVIPDGEGKMKRRVRGGVSGDFTFADFRQAWERDSLDARLDENRQSYIGLRLAAARGRVQDRGMWVNTPRVITFHSPQRDASALSASADWARLSPPVSPKDCPPGFESEALAVPSGHDALMRWGLQDLRYV